MLVCTHSIQWYCRNIKACIEKHRDRCACISFCGFDRVEYVRPFQFLRGRLCCVIETWFTPSKEIMIACQHSSCHFRSHYLLISTTDCTSFQFLGCGYTIPIFGSVASLKSIPSAITEVTSEKTPRSDISPFEKKKISP